MGLNWTKKMVPRTLTFLGQGIVHWILWPLRGVENFSTSMGCFFSHDTVLFFFWMPGSPDQQKICAGNIPISRAWKKKSYFWWLRSLHFLTLHALRSSKCLAGYGEPHQISTLEIHQHICGMNALNVFGSLQWKQIQKTTRTYTNAIISVRMLTCACVHVPLLVPGSQPEKTQFCFRHCFAFNLGKLIFGHWQQIDSPWSAFLSCIFDFEIW